MERTGVSLTEAAAKEASRALQENGKQFLRLWVEGGGCSGFSYGLALDSETSPGDTEFESNGVRVVVDKLSLNHVLGATIEYDPDVMGGSFAVNNPRGPSCGCGAAGGCDPGDCGCS